MNPTRPVGEVDVVIPLYNNGAFIGEAIASVLAQTVLPRTITVVDDGSVDDGPARVNELIATYSGPVRITLLQQANAGPNSARNAGLRHGSAPYVAFLDADDRWERTKLEKQLALFERPGFADLLLVYCGAHVIDAAGTRKGPDLTLAEPLRGHVFDHLLAKNVITGGSSAVMIARAAFAQAGTFDEELRASEDFDMWLRIAQAGSVDLVTEDLVALRDHGRNTTKSTLPMLRGIVAFNAKWFPHARTKPVVLHEWGHLIALFVARAEDMRAAYRTVDAALDQRQQRLLFRRAGGSLRLYVLMKKWRARWRGERP